jgi:hypothetical protein
LPCHDVSPDQRDDAKENWKNQQRTKRLHEKRKGRPATGRPFLQGRIVPTEARPSKLSEQIL